MAASARVVVVGAGITGLAAARALSRSGTDLEVLVLEGSPRVGGKLLLGEVCGAPVDLGAESLLYRRPEAARLARAVGLGEAVCHPATARAAIWTRGAVRPMPPTVMGIPADLAALRRSGIVSGAAVAAARLRSALPRSLSSADVSVADFVSQRLGHDVTDRLVEPLLGGVYAGNASRLSLQAAAPAIAALAERGGSLLVAARAAADESAVTTTAPVFAGLRGGVGRLPHAVVATAGITVRTEAPVRELARREGWRLVVGPTRGAEIVTADAVVLATPAAPTARLLQPVCGDAARDLRGIEYASTAVITLAVPATSMVRSTGSGFLVPAVDNRVVKAVTYSSRKWAWLAREAGDDVAIMRASIGRHGEQQLLQRDDHDLVTAAVRDLEAATGGRLPLLDSRVTRWGGALPQYHVGHRERVVRIRDAVSRIPLLEVCGAAYDGIGVAACVADGERAADRLLAALRTRETMAP